VTGTWCSLTVRRGAAVFCIEQREDIVTASPGAVRAVQDVGTAGGDVQLGPFAKLAARVSHIAGRPPTFALSCFVIVAWGLSGPLFHYSDTWQLVINTGTTIVTFLMVFLIQNTQNREGAALQAKLDELIRATRDAHNALVGLERLPEEAVEEIRNEVVQEARE
jgi:low affinity Fe/Cu permease